MNGKIYIFPAIILVLTGCSNLDFSRGPMEKVSDVIDSGKPFTKEDKKAVEKAKYERLTQLLAEWQRQRTSAPEEDYLVGTDDVLDVEIVSIEQPGVTSKLSRTVDKEGKITLPLINRIVVSGLKELDISARIAAAYGGKYLKDPEVSVKVREYKSAVVIVTGAVQKPGVCYLQKNMVSVLDVLSMAGGLSSASGDKLYISRSLPAGTVNHVASNSVQKVGSDKPGPNKIPVSPGQKAEPDMFMPQRLAVDLHQLIEEGEVSLNVAVKKGDIVTIPPKVDQYVYVLGYVQRPGPIVIKTDQPLKALNALAMVGGLTYQGRAEKSYLIRDADNDKKVIIDIDLSKVARGVRPDVNLRAGDTLVVGSGFFMKMAEIIRPTVSAGASVSAIP